MSNNIKWKRVFKTNRQFEAELVKGNLENNNIPAIVVNKQDSSYLAFGYVEVHVPEQLEEKATSIINS
jgi:hypothetical protein